MLNVSRQAESQDQSRRKAFSICIALVLRHASLVSFVSQFTASLMSPSSFMANVCWSCVGSVVSDGRRLVTRLKRRDVRARSVTTDERARISSGFRSIEIENKGKRSREKAKSVHYGCLMSMMYASRVGERSIDDGPRLVYFVGLRVLAHLLPRTTTPRHVN